MNKFLKNSIANASKIISLIFMLIPEEMLKEFKLINFFSQEKINAFANRVLICLFAIIFVIILYLLRLYFYKNIHIKDKNYNIKVSYGDIFEMENCKKVIPFDECFTVKVGKLPWEIKKDSLCGQYLEKYHLTDIKMKKLIKNVKLEPNGKSEWKMNDCYEQGSLVPAKDDFLLMSFAKLDKDGRGVMTIEDFQKCLLSLWKEIDKHYAQKNVCIPILGSGITRFKDRVLTQQELLDIIIFSYKLNCSQIKHSCCLHIVCKQEEGFSLSKIGEAI